MPLLPAQTSHSKYLQGMRGATPRVPEAGLDPWLCLFCFCTHCQRPRQLAFGLIGAGEGQSTAQPGGAARGSPGALVSFPGRTLAPRPLGSSRAEEAPVFIYVLALKKGAHCNSLDPAKSFF